MSLREHLPPTVIAAIRLLRTRLTLAGARNRAERDGRLHATAALRALPAAPPTGRRVLVFSLRGGWYPHTAWESVIAHGLHLRGAQVHVFNCGGPMPICEVNFRHASPAVACAECRAYPAALNDALPLERSWLRDHLTDGDVAAITAAVRGLPSSALEGWMFDGIAVGRLVRNSVLWFLRKTRLDLDGPDGAVYRDFLVSGAQIARAAPRLLARARPDVVLELNGLFFAEQILNACLPPACRVVTYEAGWRLNSLGFDWFSDKGFADLDDAWAWQRDRPLAPHEERQLDEWIAARRGGDMQRDFYVRFDSASGRAALSSLGLDPDRRTAVLFTNLVWDTAVFGRDLAFPSISEWLRAVIGWFATRPDRQLVVRIHPAEDLRPSQESNEKLSDVVKEMTLPPNVRLVPSAAVMSSYSLIEAASAVLVYTSTAGLEAALYGKSVMTGARVYYAGRGFTREVASIDGFAPALDGMLAEPGLDDAQRALARRFAYLLLFRFLHDLPVVRQRPRDLPLLDPRDAPRVAPGGDPDFDALLDAIVSGGPLVRVPAELTI